MGKIKIKTNRPIGFIITDSKGKILKKGGPTKKLIKKHKAEMKKRGSK